MKSVITYETLRRFTYSNDHLIQGRIRGIVLHFTGLGGQSMQDADDDEGRAYAEKDIVYLRPYYNPWSWMNRQTVAFVDELVAVVLSHYALTDTTPIVASGGSMGGLCALVYTRYAERTPVRCVVNCPVCDLPYHYTERPDLPRTLYSAFGTYDTETLEEALETASPLHLADTMPKIPYVIFHCEADGAVNIDAHSIRLVRAMASYDVTLIRVPDRGHCDLSPEAIARYYAEIDAAF